MQRSRSGRQRSRSHDRKELTRCDSKDRQRKADLGELRTRDLEHDSRSYKHADSSSSSPTRRGRSRERPSDKEERTRTYRSRSSSTSSERDLSRKRRKHKSRKRSHTESDDTESSESSSSRHRKKKHKKRRNEKSEKKKKDKKEFNLWLLEVKHLNVEEVSPFMMKEHFKHFVEDYNTATFPHIKYYDVEKYFRQKRDKRNLARLMDDETDALVDLKKDEEELRKQHRQQTRVPPVTDSLLTKDQVIEIKRVFEERVQAEKLRKMGFTPKESMGVRYE
ncbi:11135_t:CDS:2 [Acaulospora morrowiae]|uniref:11135_t:CDS:1 n=1 Tax=Acaulospora morrowiae TaxID=94023 RepID=A0A9N8W3R2_9GLOM|nr:11135_t:CDS:2 [Acaulospora morrowiae]